MPRQGRADGVYKKQYGIIFTICNKNNIVHMCLWLSNITYVTMP